MTLISTSGAPDADSFVSLAEADAYFTARGETRWAGTDTAKENALRRGTAYLENQYRTRWVGIRSTQSQALSWPRVDGYRNPYRVSIQYPILDVDGFQIARDVVPVQVKNATFEAALLAITGATLEPTLIRGGAVKSTSKTVGPISKSVTYTDGAPVIDRYTAIEGILRGLVSSTPGASSGTARLVRG
jgi:hypothetical protein